MSLTGSRTAIDPSGTTWTVRPRWRVGPDLRLRRRRRDDEGRFDALSEVGNAAHFDDLLVSVAAMVVLGVVIVLAVFVFWPLIAFALEVLIAAVLLAAGVVARFVLRRPWIVEASTPSGAGRVRYRVHGYREMRRVTEAIAARIAAGEHAPGIAGAERI